MRYSAEQLKRFWRAAEADVPVVVVGGGRWGRVWVTVLTKARGSSKNIHIVARTAPESVKEWRQNTPALCDLGVWHSISDAFQYTHDLTCAVIASRPRDHIDDAMEALSFKSHVLVEKPIGDCSTRALQLIQAGAGRQQIVAVGTEFSFLPCFHYVANALFNSVNSQRFTMRLEWNDPTAEVRHGATKPRHDETSLVVDLLPHAFSILRIFIPISEVMIVDAHQSTDGQEGRIAMETVAGDRFEFICKVGTPQRSRFMEVNSGCNNAVVDFSKEPSAIKINNEACNLGIEWGAMDSTLQLEFGAFHLVTRHASADAPIVNGLTELSVLQGALERRLRGEL